MQARSSRILLCAGARTPIGHISRSLAAYHPQDLLRMAATCAIERARVPKERVDGLIAGWVGQTTEAPNLARVTVLLSGLPETAQAVTVQNNCVSSIEAVSAAARFILAGDGDVFLAGGAEIMSRSPFFVAGHRGQKELRSAETLKAALAAGSAEAPLVDSMELGLIDALRKINMAGTAELCAQTYGVTREEQDAYAHESFRRTLEAWSKGFYAGHVVPVRNNGDCVLEKDEYAFLREDLVAKPRMFSKAPLLFDNSAYHIKDFYRDWGRLIPGGAYEEGKTKGTVTLFNSCGRSDGAAAVVVAGEEAVKELGLEPVAELKGWGYVGNDPAFMGISPALAAAAALKKSGVSFDQLDLIELHEPFAATVLSLFKVGKERFGHDWQARHKDGRLNPHGGSIALGHPLGATGARLLLNLMYGLKASGGRYGMIAGCAGGGMGGALVIERV